MKAPCDLAVQTRPQSNQLVKRPVFTRDLFTCSAGDPIAVGSSFCLSRFGPSAVLRQIVQIHCVPKSVRIRHTALMDSKQSSQKTMESAHGLQNSEGTSRIRTQEPVRILKKSQRLYLQIANQLDQNLSESLCLKTRGFGLNKCLKSQAIFGSVLSKQKLPDVD